MADSAMEDAASIPSLLDTDLYKLTMQNAIFKYFPNVDVSYKYTNRTPHMHFDRRAFAWLQNQVGLLGKLAVHAEEIAYLKHTCPFFAQDYLDFLQSFRLFPDRHVKLRFIPLDTSPDVGEIELRVVGPWLHTILYEIPLLALVSEAYFRFVDTDWNHAGQREAAERKAKQLLEAGCIFSEFGSRRRRDFKTHDLVMQGIIAARDNAKAPNFSGKLAGTSNVHLARKYNLMPIGTVAHEWFMGIAAITRDYAKANELGLQYWIGTFGRNSLSIALTDTFGTDNFLKAFAREAPPDFSTDPTDTPDHTRYADIFTGTRQDSGDPVEFVAKMKRFYDEQDVKTAKTIVFSDSLNVDKCITYKAVTKDAGLNASFGIGTFFTNDFTSATKHEKSEPLNIVIKLETAEGHPAVKLSDNIGKNTGDSQEIARVKQQLGYTERKWQDGDEAHRW